MLMMNRAALAALIAVAMALPGIASSRQSDNGAIRWNRVMVGDTLDPRLRGIWRDSGNGWLLDFTGPHPALYNETKVDCLRDPVEPPQIIDYVATYWTGNRRRIGLTARPDIFPAHFDRIAALPVACRNPPPPTPAHVFNSLVANFTEHYPDFRVRHVNWQHNVAAARARIRDGMPDAELFAVLSDLLRPLDDSHVTLADPKDQSRYFEEGLGKTLRTYFDDPKSPGYPDRTKMRPAFMKAWTESVERDLLGGQGTKAANGRLFYGFAAPQIAYIGPTAFYNTAEGLNWRHEGDEYSRTLDKAFTSFAGAKALIIDLSNHRGGSPGMARDLASRVAPVHAVGAFVRIAHPAGLSRHAWDVSPQRNRPRFDGPVYVLVSDITVSAGEFTTLLLRALPNSLIVGERTRGSLSGLIDKTLPNGWKMEMPNQFIVTPKGEDFAAVGIPPEVQLPIYGRGRDPFQDHREAVREVIGRIQQCQFGRSDRKPCW